jgi:retron-type reverse transcriptase
VKRENFLIDRIADPDNLRLAFWKASRSKTGKAEVFGFRNNLDENLLLLRGEILGGKPAVGNYRYFKVFDPKERLICASAFRERVLHHALMNVAGDSFERFQIYAGYACRIGKGTYAALERAETFQKRHAHFLKLDVRKYFAPISHEILKRLLHRRFKERRLLDIFGAIVESCEAAPGRGLPIDL